MTEDLIVRPRINENDLVSLVRSLYGLYSVEVKELNGYDDKNFKIIAKKCENNHIDRICEFGYVLKITNTHDSKNLPFMDATNKLMMYLGNNGISCPKPVKNVEGEYFSTVTLESGNHVIRLMEYIPGKTLLNSPYTNDVFFQCGQLASKIDNIIKDFHHQAFENRSLLWNMKSVPEIRNYMNAIEDSERINTVERVIKDFEKEVLEKLHLLEKGLIHGDFNESNIILDEDESGKLRVKSILDFGDSSMSYYLFEVAIAMTYVIILSKNLDAGGYVLAGYTKTKPMPKEEKSLLRICILARLCQSLVLGAYFGKKESNNDYILTTQKNGWGMLEELLNKPVDSLLQTWEMIEKSF